MARKLWLTRHGESEYNKLELLGGNSGLSAAGLRYSNALPSALFSRLSPDHLNNSSGGGGSSTGIRVFTSTLKRTIMTAQHLPFAQTRLPALDEIDAGVCDGKTYAQVAAEMPEEFAARQRDKLRYRYPQGESYLDVYERLQPVIQELNATMGPVCIVSHQAVLRVLYGHLMSLPLEKVPGISIPLHTLIELTFQPDGTVTEERFKVDVSAAPPSVPDISAAVESVAAAVQQDAQQQQCSKSSGEKPAAVFPLSRETPCLV